MAGGPFCPACGARQKEEADPRIGEVLADRYEIKDLIGAGGMGRVYRAVQRRLDRIVAVKVIESSGTDRAEPEELTQRFFLEARALSRLNHPNVVSVYDFGRAVSLQGTPLFLVMEYLSGPTLAQLLEEKQVIPIPRVVDILRQTLSALDEAHAAGIVHRDVKPANILLERRLGGREQLQVKVIDFGIARLGGSAVTKGGKLVGTPHYMAPELAGGGEATPAVDLYAVGIMLFEALTGRVPFDGSSALAVLSMQINSPRPDPREVAPDRRIPAALAEVCLRSIAIDPSSRYPDAPAFARALVEAAGAEPWSPKDASLFPPHSSGAPARPATSTNPYGAFAIPRASSIPDRAPPLVARDDLLLWARDRLADPKVGAVVVWGEPGSGRTRILEEAEQIARGSGGLVVEVHAEPPPGAEVGFSFLRSLIAALTGTDRDPAQAAVAARDADPLVGAGLKLVLHDGVNRSSGPVERGAADLHRIEGLLEEIESVTGGPGGQLVAVAAALRWAVARARGRAGQARLVIAIDDLDYADPLSGSAVEEYVRSGAVAGVVLLATQERRPEGWGAGVVNRGLKGLTGAEARTMAGLSSGAFEGIEGPITPLYVDQCKRWIDEGASGEPPASLADLVDARICNLGPVERRTLHALAVLGSAPMDRLLAVMPDPEGVPEAVRALGDAGLALVRAGVVRVAHAAFARIAQGSIPAGALEQLHARAAQTLEGSDVDLELCAYHAIRGKRGSASFALVQQSARLRSLRGYSEGAIGALLDGFHVARRAAMRGEEEAQQAWVSFGTSLASSLGDAGQVDQARGMLLELLNALDPNEDVRVKVLDQLRDLAVQAGRPDEAEKWAREVRRAAQSRSVRRDPLDPSVAAGGGQEGKVGRSPRE